MRSALGSCVLVLALSVGAGCGGSAEVSKKDGAADGITVFRDSGAATNDVGSTGGSAGNPSVDSGVPEVGRADGATDQASIGDVPGSGDAVDAVDVVADPDLAKQDVSVAPDLRSGMDAGGLEGGATAVDGAAVGLEGGATSVDVAAIEASVVQGIECPAGWHDGGMKLSQ